MNNASSNKNTSIILLIVLIIALFFAIFYYVILPKKDEVDSLERSTKTIQEEIVTLKGQNSVDVKADTELVNIYDIRKKLPQTRELDKLLLNLEEIEYLTKSRILGIAFNNYDELVSESVIASAEEEENPESDIEEAEKLSEENKDEKSDDATEEKDEKPISSIVAESLPEDLKLLTFSIEIQTSDYKNVQLFIEEIEKLERIMHVDSIEYELGGEEAEVKGDSEEVKVTIQVTTFFYEGDE